MHDELLEKVVLLVVVVMELVVVVGAGASRGGLGLLKPAHAIVRFVLFVVVLTAARSHSNVCFVVIVSKFIFIVY